MENEIMEIGEKMGDCTEEELYRLMEDMGNFQDTLDHNGFYTIDARVDEVAKGLGLKDVGLDKNVDDLSGGQRSKVLLGKLLLESPDILLLDEPTNYLDEEHIEWLKVYLNNYENAFMLISHDIPFINSVVNLIYHMENRALTRYVGNYDEFQVIYNAKKRQMESAYEKQQQEINSLEDFISRNKARVATSNMAKSRQKKLDKMDKIELSKDKPKPTFSFKEGRTSSKLIFKTDNLVIGYDEALTKPINVYLEKGQKIALTGANGLGKSTLLKSLLGLIPPFSGEIEAGENLEIGYFEQEGAKGNYNTCIEDFWETYPGFNQYEVRSALARCGLTTKHIESKILVLSGGEQAKVRLAKVINRESNILLLDEPTNHLDQDAKDELKRALQEYRGTILLVSHEKEFYEDIATEVWNCEEWTKKLF
jgi:ATPase subunit of ABC transporter with duplicated ATPase domains